VGTTGPANGYGLLDVCGNAAEWCADVYAPYPAAAAGPLPPRVSGTVRHVVRGGSWRSAPAAARLSARRAAFAESPRDVSDVGLRAVQSVP
jgi:formylglycine-generating enzyme required for sulfatase activity